MKEEAMGGLQQPATETGNRNPEGGVELSVREVDNTGSGAVAEAAEAVPADSSAAEGSHRQVLLGLIRLLWPMYLATLLIQMSLFASIPVLPAVVREEMKASEAMFGFVVAIRGLGRLFANAAAGKIVRRFGPRNALSGSCLIMAVTRSAQAVAPDIWTFALSRLLDGGVESVYLIARLAVIGELVPKKSRGRSTSLVGGMARW
eukprot:Hpha_TRINITY_DN24589_c0_g1::TRINITY_DN24589_c0_g1_i1::g.172614::m.172614